jgi:hypothetical protein
VPKEMRCPHCEAIVRLKSSSAKIQRIDDGTGTQHVVIRDSAGRIVHECN